MSHQELSRTTEILKDLFRKHFSKTHIKLPEDFILREFAFQQFTTKKFVRHLSFQSLASLREYLIKETPLNSFYSASIYRDPAASSMEDKGLIGSELMFDIDVDHIPKCESVDLQLPEGKRITLITQECIELGKEHQLRLIDFLTKDFGISRNEIRFYFTGNRGFHTVVRPKDGDWLKMSSNSRREIVDYVKGSGLDLKLIIPHKVIMREGLRSPVKGGWITRVLNLVQEGKNSPQELAEEAIKSFAVEVDEQVTPDLSRLIRISGTLNGKSGLQVQELSSESELLSFTYGVHLSPFQGECLIRPLVTSKEVPILGEKIQLYPDQLILVPMPVGIFLALNSAATIKEIK